MHKVRELRERNLIFFKKKEANQLTPTFSRFLFMSSQRLPPPPQQIINPQPLS
ncbi:hypothetical protein LguiB_013237 [Lonicera macranthoides]